MRFEQKITRSIKVEEPSIIDDIHNKQITHVKCDTVKVGDTVLFSIRKTYESEKSAIEITQFKKTLYKFRTPKRILKYIGKTIVVSKNVLSEDVDELFRVEVPEATILLTAPYMTGSVISLPHEYINSMLDERAPTLRFSFNETTTGMMEAGTIRVYMTEESTSMSYPSYFMGRSMRSKSLRGILHIMDKLNVKLNDFEYVETLPKDTFHKYGTMVFKRREIDG